MSEELRVSIDPGGAQELEKLFTGLEKLATSASKLAGSSKSLDALRGALNGLARSGSAFAELNNSIRALETAVQGLPTQLLTAMKGAEALPVSVRKGMDGAVAEVRSGGAKMQSAVRAEIAAMQAQYEAASAKGWKIKAPVLEGLKLSGVSLFPSDRELLDSLKKRAASASKISEDDTRAILGLPSRNEMKTLAAQIKAQMEESLSTEKLKTSGATKMNIDETRRMLGLPDRGEMKTLAAQIKAQMEESLSTEKLKARSASKMTLEDTRSMLGLPSTRDMKELSTQIRLQMEEALAADAAKLKAAVASLKRVQLAEANKLSFNPAGATPMGQFSSLKTGKVSLDIEDHSPKLNNMANAMKHFGVEAGTAHSAMRGLASGFGAMFLTYGQILPLLAGSALSFGFVAAVKQGAELEQKLQIIQHLGEESAASIRALNVELLAIARSGPFGPIEVAEAMKTLSLAGLKANEIIGVTKDVLNFSVAGDTSIQAAADTLVSVTTAFATGAAGFSRAGDVIAKTAAVSKASVESISESFKTASVINAQYGVSLEDTGTGLAALAQLGIKGTAAGVALRNMYVDLSGRTPQVTKLLREQGLELRNTTTGGFRDLVTIVGELREKMMALTPIAQKDFLSKLTSERGAKPLVEMLRMLEQAPKSVQEGFNNALQEMNKGIENSYGFAAAASINLLGTTQNRMKAATSSFQAALQEAFAAAQPAVALFYAELGNLFRDPAFIAGVTSLVNSVATLGLVLLDNAKLVGIALTAWGTLRLAMAAMGPVTAVAATGLTATGVAGAAAGVGGEAAAVGMTAAGRALGMLIPVIGIATAAWLAYEFIRGRAGNTEKRAAEETKTSTMKALQDDIARMQEKNSLLERGVLAADLDRVQQDQSRFENAAAAIRKNANDAIKAEADAQQELAKLRTEYAGYASRETQRKIRSKEQEVAALGAVRARAKQAENAELDNLQNLEKQHREVYKRNAELVAKQGAQAMPSGLNVFGIKKPNRFEQAQVASQETASWKHVEEAYKKEAQLRDTQHKQRMQDIQRDFTDEKALLDNALKNKLISEGTHYAQSLSQTVAAEDRRLNEIRRGYEEQANLISENMAKLRAANPDVEAQAAASPDTLKGKSKLIQEQAAAYRGLQTDLQKVLGTMKSETATLEDQIRQRQRLLAQDLRGVIMAEANEYKELGRSLEVSVQQQKSKLDAANSMVEATAEETAGIKAATEFENKHADAISKRADKLTSLKQVMTDIGAERDALLQAGVPEDDSRVVALSQAYTSWGVAVDDSTAALARMRNLVSQGSGYARLAADAEEARKSTLKLRDDISKNLAEALMRGTAGFKSLWGGLIDWLKNTFAETVLTPQIKMVMNQVMGIGPQGGGNPLSGIGNLLTNGISDGISGAFTKFAESTLGNKMGLSYGYGEVGQNVATSTAKTAGNVMGTLGNGYTGYQLSKGLSGGYSVTGGNTLNNIGAAASMYFGPIAGVVTGAINRLFGMKAKEVTDTGIKGTLGSDSSLSTFQDWKQKGGLFRSDKKGTETAALSIEQEQTLNVAAKSILKSAADASEALGLSGDAFANFTKDVNISFGKDGSGAQEAINKALTDFANDAIDSALGDSLDPYRRAGESLTDTLSRLGSATKQVDNAFKAMGVSVEKVFGSGLASADLKSQLADQFGGGDALGNALGNFYQNFFSETERTKQGLQLLGDEFNKLGLGALPKTREEFKQTTLDFLNNSGLRTEADQKTFQSLIQMSESFATLVPAVDEAALAAEAAQKAEDDLAKARDEAAAAAEKLRSMYSSLDGIIGDFLSGDALINYRAGRVQQKLGEAGISSTREGVLGSTREDIMALWESVGVDGKIAIQEAYGAWNDLQDALLAGSRKMEEMYSSLDGVVSDFLGGQDLANYRADRISAKLNAGGIQASREGVLGATKEDIFALWLSLGDEGKITLQELYGDWKEMNQALIQSDIDAFLSGLNTTADELMGAYDEINPKAKNLVQSWRDTSQELDSLKSGLEDILGLKPKTALENLADTLAKRNGLNDVISSNKDQIFDLTVAKGGNTALTAMKQKEAELWAEFASTRSPEVASAITKLTLDRIKLEDSLREKANETQLEALNEQISAAEQLKAVAKEMPKFLLSLKAGSLSNLSYGGRLDAQRQLFEQSLTTGQDVQGQAQSYLQQAQEMYGGSSTQYTSIFQEVTAQLEQLGLTGVSQADQQIAQAQAQIDAITGGTDRQIEALMALNAEFGTTRDSLTAEADQQVELLNKQIQLMEDQKANQEAAITQAGEAYKRMIEALESLDEATITANQQSSLARAAPKLNPVP